jgi:hypothetical protein
MTTATQEEQSTPAIIAQEELQESGIDTPLNGSTYWHTSNYRGDHSC